MSRYSPSLLCVQWEQNDDSRFFEVKATYDDDGCAIGRKAEIKAREKANATETDLYVTARGTIGAWSGR